MASLEASLRAQASVPHELADLMKKVNNLVYEASSENRYATLFYAEYDPRECRLCYVNAGHNPPVVLRKTATTCDVIRLEAGGPVIGLVRESYQQESFPLQAGDQIVLFTDGVSESMNVRGEEWGEDRLIHCAKTCHGLSARQAMTQILSAADAFAAGASQHDDMTLVVLNVMA
jgi:sigma-B regulation protein RsbU (phosphoserine phosphatase)